MVRLAMAVVVREVPVAVLDHVRVSVLVRAPDRVVRAVASRVAVQSHAGRMDPNHQLANRLAHAPDRCKYLMD
jgi:hypothetical protein